MTTKLNFDVIVVGGGMVGAAVACALGGSSLSVAVIEQMEPQLFAQDQPHDLRVSALSIASKRILETLGAWQGVISRRYCPFRRMRVWETAGDTEFCSDDIGYSELGFIVENRITQLALLERLKDFSNVTLICPTSIKNIEYNPLASVECSTIMLDDGRELTAKLVVAADGGQSRIRQKVGLGVTSWDYKQHAMVIYVETDYPQQDITWQRFLPSGPQAFLPLNGPFASLVWYNSVDEIQRLKSLPQAQLMIELKEAFPECLGDLKAIIGTASFPLKRQHAQDYVKQGVALVGDAAHMINPLAGQGVNIGLLDAAALGEVVLDAYRNGEFVGDIQVLKRYEKTRKLENLRMMTVMDAFYQIFSNKILPLKIIRNFGLGLAGRIKPAKNKVMRHAMGLEGDLPKLARGKPII
ncbi:UbiH/UbiF/VisC/COQ6 family ubiquinone biosynthesis hydroxylase [Methylicorpusculum sp.]|uniref:UbiH/UbiF/VisC/COQ6 family ubiquinone biosynthesis hydroxylase n=1 Tax=Methylicorpusculum sp. TaxID=2713644 RepID=UPI0027219EEC|nr:UbiH/UbiF/VisC/COQ6 family ubiquinone biosynthesis hydroxylase [Methylicorpusculum sp.]MDO8844596.1 UbiH/UbiF/VisC/COQ6 family ubiquinone biosynthesis hydroxylase [Methylicorpusculum sp.]MDP2178588.1 UbiH/UbiF/VisC/COQ6 family ubiquinone biosynthesis hydroxylase [Methylicorpusculum sp.]MDP3530613.1 UbiH/UbiF/VisC/COQ6 family ubiquinone biosynthesis hydroxylase [Methylicorpusculum sp.]MDZ4151018.1 UbiH/UbiF/VisC/COQ6 family ubiquinone biosynthesis hydroxylase [Methylicorpusculum sp.]